MARYEGAWGVVRELRERVIEARSAGDRKGYFMVLYLAVAEGVAKAIDEGTYFSRPDLIEALNTGFFDRYAAALDADALGGAVTPPWRASFDATLEAQHIVLQHLISGMSAHIHYDLPIAISDSNLSFDELEDDYVKMNNIFEALLPRVSSALTELSPTLAELLEVLQNEDEFMGIQLAESREAAWQFAWFRRIAGTTLAQSLIDPAAAAVCQQIQFGIFHPTFPIRALVESIHAEETLSVAEIIDLLLGFVNASLDLTVFGIAVPSSEVRKVAIIGGGMGGLAAALCLKHPNNPKRDLYEVTVYQMGWRLGGKCATGRNPILGERNQEHGLHCFFGFYENTFRLLHDVYSAMPGSPGGEAAWLPAFEPVERGAYWELLDETLKVWPMKPPSLPTLPGRVGVDGAPPEPFNLHTIAAAVLEWIAAQVTAQLSEAPWLAVAFNQCVITFTNVVAALDVHASALTSTLLDLGLRLVWSQVQGRLDTMRRTWILIHLGVACIRGSIESRVFADGFDVINHRDFRDWVSDYAIDDGGLMLDSVVMRAAYDGSFAFAEGDTTVPSGESFPPGASMEAGTMLRGIVRAVFTGHVAFGWKMKAGAGDAVFAPLYQVLQQWGVKFRFFRQLEKIGLSADGASIDTLDIAVQTTIYGGDDGEPEYKPLRDVGGLQCWPDRPIPLDPSTVPSSVGPADPLELENPNGVWRTLPQKRDISMIRGSDFDEVVLAIPPAASKAACVELEAKYVEWQTMYSVVASVRTQAAQLWMTRGGEELGLPAEATAGRPVVTFWNDPDALLNVFSDYRMVLPTETWTPPAPRAVLYFCSPLSDAVPEATAYDVVKANSLRFLNDPLWRTVLGAADQVSTPAGDFDWELLHDPSGGVGAARLDVQYFRANVAPSERYVLSLPGSSKHRLPARDPHVAGLYLAGDWTLNTLNCGCMEAATMSGMMASAALSSWPPREKIIGADF